jgi:regulator of cell morphogenesis and NO signaling
MNSTATNTAVAKDNRTASWAERPPSEIIAFILRRYHEPLHRDLSALLASARKVEEETRADPLCPAGIGEHLEQILLAVESHLAKEEKILFPLILAGRGGAAFMPIKVMMAEHEDHVANLGRTRALTHDFRLPTDASASWRALYLDLRRLEADLNQHIELENNILFTRVMGGDSDGL